MENLGSKSKRIDIYWRALEEKRITQKEFEAFMEAIDRLYAKA